MFNIYIISAINTLIITIITIIIPIITIIIIIISIIITIITSIVIIIQVICSPLDETPLAQDTINLCTPAQGISIELHQPHQHPHMSFAVFIRTTFIVLLAVY